MHAARGLHLVASGHRHPDTVLGTDALEATLPNLRPGWTADRLGIETRRVALPHERVADLGAAALMDALERAGWESHQLDLVVCGASFLEALMPARASVIAEMVSPAALAFDVNAACSSFVYSLSVAASMLASEPTVNRAAVCVVERPTASADYSDAHSSVFFGDSAAAVLVQREAIERGWLVVGLALSNDAVGSGAVTVPFRGHFRHDNRDALRHVVNMGEKVVAEVLAENGLSIDDISAVIGHQANTTVLGALGERLGVPWERQWHNFEWAGNQGAAGVATAFSEGWCDRSGELRPGDFVVLVSVGSGYTAGAVLLRWLG